MKPTYLNRFVCLLLLLLVGTPWALQAQNPPPKKVCIVKNSLYEKTNCLKDLLYQYQYRYPHQHKTDYNRWPYSSFSPEKSEVITDSYQNAFVRLLKEKKLDQNHQVSIDVVTDLLASMLEKTLVAQGCQVEIVSAFDWTKFAREITHSRYISFMTSLVVGQTPELTAALSKKTGADVIVYLDGTVVGHTTKATTQGVSSSQKVTGDRRVSMSAYVNIAKGDITKNDNPTEMQLAEWNNTPISELGEINLVDDVMICSQKIAEQLSEQITGKQTSKQEAVAAKKKICLVSNTQTEPRTFQNFDKFYVRKQGSYENDLPDYLGDIEMGELKRYHKFYLAYEIFSGKQFSAGRDIFWSKPWTVPLFPETASYANSARRVKLPYLDPSYLIDYMTFQLKMDGYEVSVYFPWDIMALAKETGSVVKPKKPTSERGVVIDEPLLAALRKATGAETIIVGEGIHYDVDIKSERSKEDAVTGFSKMDLSYKTTIYQQGQPAKENLFEGDFETHWDGMTRDQVWQVYELPLMYQQCIEEITGQIRTTYKDI